MIIFLPTLNEMNTSVSIYYEYNFLLQTTSHHNFNFDYISLMYWGQVMH